VKNVWPVVGGVQAVLARNVPVIVAVQQLEVVPLCLCRFQKSLIQQHNHLQECQQEHMPTFFKDCCAIPHHTLAET
jgi:hypothetical protein